jgi:hypothetical protein
MPDRIDETRLVSPLFQIILILISTTVLTFALYYRLSLFRIKDPRPEIHTVTPEKLFKLGGFVDVIETGLYIDRFQTFDMTNNRFVFTGIVWFSVNPGTVSINTLENFSFRAGEILERSKPETKLIGDKLWVAFTVRVSFTSLIDYTYFPFDNHRIYLLLTNTDITPSEFLFESTNQQLVINKDITSVGWKLINTDVNTGYYQVLLDPKDNKKILTNPIVVFSLDYVHASIRYLLSILLPIILILYISLFSFSLTENTITLTSLGITALVSYRFVIENISPNVSYFMLSDYMFFIFLIAAFIIFFINIADLYLQQFSSLQKKIFISGIHFFTIGGSIYFFLFWR